MNASIKYGAALVVGLALFGAAAQAAPVVSNPTIVSGGITFSNFTIQVTSQGALSFPTMNSAVNVNGLGNGAAGIQFSSGFTSINGGFSDAKITYVASGVAGLSSIGLSFDGDFLGLAIASVTESIYSDAAFLNQVGFARVSCGVAVGCTRSVSVNLSSSSFDTLYVTKDINVTSSSAPPPAGVDGNFANLSVVTQSYGTPTAVPEPMSIALFGTGLVGLGLVRRARKAAKAA